MRRKLAANLSHCFTVIWSLAVFSSITASGYEFLESYALTVTTGDALHEAFLNRNVSVIYLGQDISLSQDTWSTGWRRDPESGTVLHRNVTLTTHPSLQAPANLYLDYMENRVIAGAGTLLSINGVVLTGVSNDARNYFFVPFFQFESNGALLIENSQVELAIDPPTLWNLEDYPSKIQSLARPEGYEDWPVEVSIVPQTDCELNSLRSVPCQEGALWIASLSARLTVFNKDLGAVGKAAFLAKNVLMIAIVVGEFPKSNRTLAVGSAQDFKAALLNPQIDHIHVSNDLNLTDAVFPKSFKTPITRNLTIHAEAVNGRRVIMDFNYLRDRVVAVWGVQITFVETYMSRTTSSPQDFELIPFFSLQPGAKLVFRDVVSEMVMDETSVYPLKQLPYALYGGDVPNEFAAITNDVSVVTEEWCAQDGRIMCPYGALWIKRGVRRLQVLDAFNQELLGEGFVDAYNTLIKIVMNETAINGSSVLPLLVEDNDEAEILSKEEERRSFGFIGGFDPWLLIYALGVAAILLGVCLFVTLMRRRRDNKRYANARSVKSEESLMGEEDGMRAHQKVARQLLGDVKLGTLLGCGSFGRVYKALWSGAPVAVKVILHQEDEGEVEQEAQFSISLRHPNVVQTFHYAVRTVEESSPTPKRQDNACSVVNINCEAGDQKKSVIDNGMSIPSSWMKSSNGAALTNSKFSEASAQSSVIMTEEQSRPDFVDERWLEMWLIQEYCNQGCLGKQNFMRINDQNSVWGSKHPGMHMILDTCKDIARGMKYLHDNGIVHGDLKCDNILIQSSPVDRKGFIAKVADFGLSRKLGPSTHLSTKSFGTITHMPPELLLDGHLSSKVDVYSFGIIMWELISGMMPYRDLRYAEVMKAIVVDDKRPVFESSTPSDYVTLAKKCWDRDPARRPSYEDVLGELDKMSSDIEIKLDGSVSRPKFDYRPNKDSISDSSSDGTDSWESESEGGSTNKGCT